MTDSMRNQERRRSKRVVLASTLRCQSSQDRVGKAGLRDVDLNGICVALSQPLVRGELLMLEVDEPKHGDGVVELKGRVVWCRKMGNEYHAGIRVYHDESDVRVALCALMCAALKRQAAIASLRDRHFLYAEWKLAALAASEESGWVWKKRERPVRAAPNKMALGY